ncbi:hypothetical protein RYH70_08060 [Alloalcanivorax xenomutans]|uniref:hypothetical protein n=1 Tax=Alloalcanivorax xenomutans TaxID=1094342 RepID=UPI00293530F5|nr:hypothetical protein [Alloalcanivorax xenomutans]WOD30018.1 hypothetical protein RYH70_08060 [Alloalcanivorax xenomutans]
MRANDILPDEQSTLNLDGVTIRKGSVGAFLVNARLWLDPATPEPQRREAERDLAELLPALEAPGLFDILQVRQPSLRQWLDDQREGR